jgi:hypothetical protein
MKRVLPLLALLLAGCSDGKSGSQALAVLVDTSGTYADQKPEVVNVVKKGLLPRMVPGDSMVVIRIADKSYSRDEIEGSVLLDARPSHATAQKLAFAGLLDAFAAKPGRARYTDVRGAMMLAADWLRDSDAGDKVIVVFSDLQEELPKGVTRTLSPTELSGTRILGMNVKRLDGDNRNPTAYRDRLAWWDKTLRAAGAADSKSVEDPDRLLEELDRGR